MYEEHGSSCYLCAKALQPSYRVRQPQAAGQQGQACLLETARGEGTPPARPSTVCCNRSSIWQTHQTQTVTRSYSVCMEWRVDMCNCVCWLSVAAATSGAVDSSVPLKGLHPSLVCGWLKPAACPCTRQAAGSPVAGLIHFCTTLGW